MSKILVVEPHKILQRAIAVSFFPEHEVQITDKFPDMNGLEQRFYDIVVIDAGALRETNPVGELNRRVQDWQIPTIWLEETISTAAPARDRLVVLRKPIVKNDLIAALAQCQGKASTMPLARASDEGEKVGGKEILTNAELKADSERKKARIIELVDVVEEGAARRRDRRLERKKK
jgi:hypothetical protein